MDNKTELIAEHVITKAGLVANEKMAIIFFKNLGDWYSLCSSIRYAEKTLQKKFVLLFESEKHMEIASWFSYDDYELSLLRLDEDEYNTLFNERLSSDFVNKYGDYIITWVNPCPVTELVRNVSEKYPSSFLRSPRIPSTNMELYKDYGIVKGQTVIIIPFANAVKSPPDWFWILLARILESIGYRVLFNVDAKYRDRFESDTIMPPLGDMVNLANYCGHVYGVRCGLFDVISSSSAKMTIISTPFFKPLDKVYDIDNNDNRIRTIYYQKGDYFGDESFPTKYINNYLNSEKQPLLRMIHQTLGELSADVEHQDTMAILNAFKPWPVALIFPRSDHYKISAFCKPTYSYKIIESNLLFAVHNVNHDDYRLNYELRYYGKAITFFQNFDGVKLLFELKRSGRYEVFINIIDKKTFHNIRCLTKPIVFHKPPLNSLNEIRKCCDFESYIQTLHLHSKNTLILISTKDTHCSQYPKNNKVQLSFIRLLGITTDLENTFRHSFLSIIMNGKLIEEKNNEKESLSLETELLNHSLKLISSGYNSLQTNKTPIELSVDGKNYAVNHRGLNILVWDIIKQQQIDSVCFDIYDNGNAFRNN